MVYLLGSYSRNSCAGFTRAISATSLSDRYVASTTLCQAHRQDLKFWNGRDQLEESNNFARLIREHAILSYSYSIALLPGGEEITWHCGRFRPEQVQVRGLLSQYHIAVVAPPWYPVPPSGYGGIELVVHLLVQGLRQRGIRTTLFAAEGSGHDAVTLSPQHWVGDLGHTYHEHREMTYLARVMDELNDRDVGLIHDHCGVASPLVLSQLGLPVLHTVHGPIYEPTRALYESLNTRVSLAAISASQRATAPHLGWAGTVHNAVDIDSLKVARQSDKEDYLLCLARISPEKGQHLAIEVAQRSGRRLVLAGKVGEAEADRRYFEEQIKPHINSTDVIYLENISGDHKATVLAQASCLLAPVQWDEPFGLAMVEAMASGTPCLAFARGAVPELIDHGATGFICHDLDEMVDSVSRAGEIEPEACAQIARTRFSPQAMADAYISLYETLLATWPSVQLMGAAKMELATTEAVAG